ncbi:MAG: hypothetical protein MZV64_27260 [Ignavibacteriales bacterium]|nr:hypothetical protein [Ignavibacteriales bacterium]
MDLFKKKKNILELYKALEPQLRAFKKEIEKDKVRESQITLSNILVYLVDNSEFIHKKVYNQFVKVKNSYQENIFSIKILNLSYIKNKIALCQD